MNFEMLLKCAALITFYVLGLLFDREDRKYLLLIVLILFLVKFFDESALILVDGQSLAFQVRQLYLLAIQLRNIELFQARERASKLGRWTEGVGTFSIFRFVLFSVCVCGGTELKHEQTHTSDLHQRAP